MSRRSAEPAAPEPAPPQPQRPSPGGRPAPVGLGPQVGRDVPELRRAVPLTRLLDLVGQHLDVMAHRALVLRTPHVFPLVALTTTSGLGGDGRVTGQARSGTAASIASQT